MTREQQDARRDASIQRRFLRVITALLLLWALKASAVITFPLLFAIFLLFFIWPVQRRLQRFMPDALASTSTLICVLVVSTAIGASLLYSGYMVSTKLPEYSSEIQHVYDELQYRVPSMGLPTRDNLEESDAVATRVADFVAGIFTTFLTTGGFLVLVSIFLVLGLVEIPRFQERLAGNLDGDRATHINAVLTEVSEKLHGFMIVRTMTSAATGLLTGLVCWAAGLELAFVWGLLAFMLNYIPTLGSIIAVIPPSLMAIVQFSDTASAVVLILLLTFLQMVIGNFVDPRLQGRWVAISPLAAFFSLVFWGWIGGVPGAILGVPLTIGLIITAYEFPSLRWISLLLADMRTKSDFARDEKS